MSGTLQLRWRDMTESDRGWVFDSWMKSYLGSAEMTRIDRDVYWAMYRPIVERLLGRSTVRIAYDAELGPDTILGWRCMAADEPVLHYVHVRGRFRRNGIARWMLDDVRDLPDGIYSHGWHAPARLLGEAWKYEPWRRVK